MSNRKLYTSGQAVLIIVVLLTMISVVVVGQASAPAKEDIKLARSLFESKHSSFISESGLEDVSYRLRKAWDYDGVEVLGINGYYATTNVSTNNVSGIKSVLANSSVQNLLRSH